MLEAHAALSHEKTNHDTQHQAEVTVALVQNVMALCKARPLLCTKRENWISIGTVKESELVFVFLPVPVKMGYGKVKGK